MSNFDSHRDYWRFVESVNQSRYFRQDPDIRFLETLFESSQARRERLPASSILYRAQIGHDWFNEEDAPNEDCVGTPCQYPPERMKPLPDRASEGRANSKGIPVLYLATHQATAVSEVRPWVGAYVSVAAMELQRELQIVNCTEDDQRIRVYGDNGPMDPAKRALEVWRDIDRAFARPFDPSDQTIAGYAPTQIIAEFFRRRGLDGVAYRSAMGGKGHNVALFDPTTAEIVRCDLLQVKAVAYSTVEVNNPYYVKSKLNGR